VSLYLYAQFLEMLDYRTIDCTTKVGVLICDDTSFVTDAIIYILTVRKWVVGWDDLNRRRAEVYAPEDHLRRGTD
jgi:hypothetical protein